MVCSLSGAPLNQPVVSSKTGHLFEKSTILHYIALHGTCPHTGQPLDRSNLIELAGSNTVILPNHQSIPALTEKLASEMDVLILEAHMLKQKLRERR
jgi:pre-mRNA-processing factor 19